MSHMATAWAWSARPETTAEKFMLVLLADRHNRDTGRCDASMRRLAADLMVQERTARRLLHSLERQGFLRIVTRYSHGQQVTNQYELMMGEGDTQPSMQQTARGTETTPLGRTETHPLGRTETHPKPEVELEVEPTTTLDGSSDGLFTAQTPLLQDPKGWGMFLTIWQHYPRTRRRNKQEAWKAFLKLSDDDREAAHEDVVTNLRGLHDRQWRDGYSPEPHRYMKRRQWNDEWEPTDETRQRDQDAEPGRKLTPAERVQAAYRAEFEAEDR